jgi:hypothetical protein
MDTAVLISGNNLASIILRAKGLSYLHKKTLKQEKARATFERRRGSYL